MIKCPRCGFTQPKDRYCAQCGLDIDNYRPPQTPLMKKVFGDPFIQLSAVLLIAVLAGLYVYSNHKREIHDRVSFFRRGIQLSRGDKSTLAPAPETPETSAEGGADAPPSGLSAQEEATASSTAAAGTSGAPPASVADANPAAPGSAGARPDASHPSIQMKYVEVNNRILEQIYAESRQSGQFNSLGDHVAGVWPQSRKKLSTLRGLKVLSKEDKTLDTARTLQFFVGLKGNDPENDLGLSTYLEISGVDAQGLHGHLEVVRAWREGTPENPNAIQRRFYPAAVDIPIDAEFFLVGILPRVSAMDNDPYLTNMDPFKILKSNAFKANEAEFLMLLDFDKSN